MGKRAESRFNQKDRRMTATIRKYMALQGVTGSQMAEHLSMTRATFSTRMTGKSAWPLNDLREVQMILKIPKNELLDDVLM